MYKCGWNGCEKAYGTLNHLNAHVTMQSHGQKRTPEGTSVRRPVWCQKHEYFWLLFAILRGHSSGPRYYVPSGAPA